MGGTIVLDTGNDVYVKQYDLFYPTLDSFTYDQFPQQNISIITGSILYLPEHNLYIETTDDLSTFVDGEYTIEYTSNGVTINNILYNVNNTNIPINTNILTTVEIRNSLTCSYNTINTALIVLSKIDTVVFTNISADLTITPDTSFHNVQLNFNEQITSSQLNFVSFDLYPPGCELSILGFKCIVSKTQKQQLNVYNHSCYLKIVIDQSALSGVNTVDGAFTRVSHTNPYEYKTIPELTVAYELIGRNEQHDTLETPYEKSFSRWCSKYELPSSFGSLEQIYKNSNILVIPYYDGNDTVTWKSVSSLDLDNGININELDIESIESSARWHDLKIFTLNQYKKAVTMYDIPFDVLSNIDNNDIQDTGMFLFACDGDTWPTVRFTYDYNISYQQTKRIESSDTANDSSDTDVNWWNIEFDDTNAINNIAAGLSKMLQFLKFTSNPKIVFESAGNHYLDSYIPRPISPWNFQVYFMYNENGKLIPTSKQHVYRKGISISDNKLWTGSTMSVSRINLITMEKFLNKQIIYQGWKGIGDNKLTPFSLLRFEKSTNMPLINENIVNEYLNNLSLRPDVPYNISLISGFQEYIYEYGITEENYYEFTSMQIDITDDFNISITADGKNIPIFTKDINSTTKMVILTDSASTETSAKPLIDFPYDNISFNLPRQNRGEWNVILVFANAVYYCSYRNFNSPLFLGLPYCYKAAEYNEGITDDYDIITVKSFTNLITKAKELVTKTYTLKWSGTKDEFTNIYEKLLPYRGINFNGVNLIINNTSINIDGDYVTITITADNRYRLWDKFDVIPIDKSINTCNFEVFPRIPNNMYPTSMIYGYSNRLVLLQQYLDKISQYSYADDASYTL